MGTESLFLSLRVCFYWQFVALPCLLNNLMNVYPIFVCFLPLFSYPGSFKQVTAAQLHHKDPTAVRTFDWIFMFFHTVFLAIHLAFLCRFLLTFRPSYRCATRAYSMCSFQRGGIRSCCCLELVVFFSLFWAQREGWQFKDISKGFSCVAYSWFLHR